MSFEYDVTLSFAGEDREFVEEVANKLRENGIKVFYDKYEQINLWGKDLYTHLSEIYSTKAQYCVIFISKYYETKLWTNHERKSAQERSFRENSEYILPFRFDDTKIPGVLDTIGYLSSSETSSSDLADAIIKKIKYKIDTKNGNIIEVSREFGVFKYGEDNYELKTKKAEFFERRLVSAFPGVRGLILLC